MMTVPVKKIFQKMTIQILQWNTNGVYKHFNKLKLLIDKFHPLIIAIQETYLKPIHQINLNNYSVFRRDYVDNLIASGGVLFLVNNKVVIKLQIRVHTNLQVTAISVYLPNIVNTPLTICNIYLPPNTNLNTADISNIINQLPPPFIICGDFNPHSSTLNSTYNNNHGNILDKIIMSGDIMVLNEVDKPTHFSVASGSFSTIDLSFCTPDIYLKLKWAVHNDLCDSDHFPIIISANNNNTFVINKSL